MYFGHNKPHEKTHDKAKPINETSMVKHLFTGDVAVSKCDDCRDSAGVPKTVSNLIQDPRMNTKYDDAWFLKHNPQYWNNLR
jgi:hypothetical protein